MAEKKADEISREIERDCRRYPHILSLEEENHAAETDEL